VLTLDHDHHLPDPLQFIIQQLTYHPTPYDELLTVTRPYLAHVSYPLCVSRKSTLSILVTVFKHYV